MGDMHLTGKNAQNRAVGTDDVAFHVTVICHGAALSEFQIDVLSQLGYTLRLGGGSVEPHAPIVGSRFISADGEGITTASEAIEYALAEYEVVLEHGQWVGAAQVMTEDAWDRCRTCHV